MPRPLASTRKQVTALRHLEADLQHAIEKFCQRVDADDPLTPGYTIVNNVAALRDQAAEELLRLLRRPE